MHGLAVQVYAKTFESVSNIVGKFSKKICTILQFKRCMDGYTLGIEGIKVRFRAHMRVKEKNFERFNSSWNQQMDFLTGIEKKMSKARPEFELSKRLHIFHKSLKAHIFNIYWNLEMKTHMMERIAAKIRMKAKTRKKKQLLSTLTGVQDQTKDATVGRQQFSFKRIKDCEFFDHVFKGEDIIVELISETRKRADTDYIEATLRSVLANLKGDDGAVKKRRGVFRAIGYFSKELQGELELNKTMEAKFKEKFEKKKVFRDMVEKMRENDKCKFKLKFDRAFMKCLIVTIHEYMI